MKTRTIRVTKNIWGNLVGFVGTTKVYDSGNEWTATDWLSERLNEGGYQLSAKSYITQADVDNHRNRLK